MSNFKIFAILATVTTASTVLVEHLPLETYGRRSSKEVALFAANETDFLPVDSKDAWATIGSVAKTGTIDPHLLINELLRGNDRYVAGTARSRTVTNEIGAPQIVIVTCADNAIPSDVIFDLPRGSVFDVRVAGNLLSPSVTESIDYATNRMGLQLVVVLGHNRCGVLRDLVESNSDEEESSSRQALLMRTAPAAIEGDSQVEDVVSNNVRWAINHLSDLPQFRRQIDDEKLKIVGYVLDDATGQVTRCE